MPMPPSCCKSSGLTPYIVNVFLITLLDTPAESLFLE